eukprot:TRINITY_DN11773_c0_g2_i2.p1 TRINITY_DN11773_c0_g2~~TRINITY_DN11773_c0_g2_i2.p1  ORF type:complete len:390 (+),score=68.27 TRINITY_DN11773_c0_g2_i2:43-1212(+)
MFKYEGCGEIGSLRAIFLAQFHHLQGPMIRCQFPEEYISKENFAILSRFLIPKNEVQEQTITVNSIGFKISGYPTFLPDKKYPRNYLLFNLCVVCHPWSRTVQFEPFVKKLSQFFTNLEKESAILSEDMEEDTENTRKIKSILEKVFNDINNDGKTVVTHEQNSLHLSVISLGAEPAQVGDHKVPILVENIDQYYKEQFDLTSTKILPHVDGFNSVARIAILSDVEVNAVRACIQNLLYHKVVELVPMFLYSNVYTPTPKLAHLFSQPEFREDIQSFQTNEEKASLRDLYTFITSFTHGTTLKDICLRLNPRKMGIDEKKLIQFLVLKGALRRIEKYPVYQGDEVMLDPTSSWFTSGQPTDLILIKSGMSAHALDTRLEEDPNILVLNK